jgi:hypothetical protein
LNWRAGEPEEKYALTVTSSPETGGLVEIDPPPGATGAYDPAQQVTLTAIPHDDYEFTGWSGDVTGTANPATLTMNGNKQATANFTQRGKEWKSAHVNWRVDYGHCWNRAGTVTVPGASRIRVHFAEVNVEACCDSLTLGAEHFHGIMSNVTSTPTEGDTLPFFLSSNDTVSGHFLIDRVDYQGVSSGVPNRDGALFVEAPGDDCDSPPPPGGWAGMGKMATTVRETAFPLQTSLTELPHVANLGTIALRLDTVAALAPEPVWTVVDAGRPVAHSSQWLPLAEADSYDGWVLIHLRESLPLGTTITVSAGATEVGGQPAVPVQAQYQVASENEQAPNSWQLVEAESVSAIPGLLATQISPAYRMQAEGVYTTPVLVQIDATHAYGANDISLYYFSECALHGGWYPAEHVDGLIVPGSLEYIEGHGKKGVRFLANHSGVFALGAPPRPALGGIAPFPVAITGPALSWRALLLSVLLVATLLQGIHTFRSRTAARAMSPRR